MVVVEEFRQGPMPGIISGVKVCNADAIAVARIATSGECPIPLSVLLIAIPEIILLRRVFWVLAHGFRPCLGERRGNGARPSDGPPLLQVRFGKFDVSTGDAQFAGHQPMTKIPWVFHIGPACNALAGVCREDMPHRRRGGRHPASPDTDTLEQRSGLEP